MFQWKWSSPYASDKWACVCVCKCVFKVGGTSIYMYFAHTLSTITITTTMTIKESIRNVPKQTTKLKINTSLFRATVAFNFNTYQAIHTKKRSKNLKRNVNSCNRTILVAHLCKHWLLLSICSIENSVELFTKSQFEVWVRDHIHNWFCSDAKKK